MTENDTGVLISDGRCSVQLSQAGQAVDWGYPATIQVRAGMFRGTVRDDLLDFGTFREQLISLDKTLSGEATLLTDDGSEIRPVGHSRGNIEVRVKIVQWNSPEVQMAFNFDIDQTYLSSIIQQIENEFPPPYRTAASIKPISNQTARRTQLLASLLRRLGTMLSHPRKTNT